MHGFSGTTSSNATGGFFGARLGLTTVANLEYVTVSCSSFPPNDEEITRVGIITRAFPGTHMADFDFDL